MWIDRQIEGVLATALRQFPAVVITGARQSGKTSLCRRVLQEADYATLDIPALADQARMSPEAFFRGRREPLILDEIQYAPEFLRYLKTVIDEDNRPGRFVLTGSQDFLLMAGVSESLAGRCAVLTLPTLSATEVERAGLLRDGDADAFFWRGGFPGLWANPETDRELWLGSYLATYLERDVRNVLNVGSLRDFDRFLRAAAARAGQLLSLSEMARDVGIAPNTARSWLSALLASHQVYLLEPYHRNVGKRLIKTPKLYFSEPGVLLYLLGYRQWPDVSASPAWGAVWENIVAGELRKLLQNRGLRRPLYFWRTAAGDEVDLVLECGPDRFLAIECKTSARVDAHDLRGLRAFRGSFGPDSILRGWVACRTPVVYPLDDKGVVAATPLTGPRGLLAEVSAHLTGQAGPPTVCRGSV